jgi:integrase/recombinase XerD
MARQNHLLHNPASEIVLPRMEHQLPKYVLTADEAEQIIQQSIRDPEGLRGSAVLETSYSTGKRRMELAHLRLWLRAAVDQPILRREKKEASARVSCLAAGAQLGLVKIEADNLSGPADQCRDGSGPIRIGQDPGLLGGAL